MVLIPGCMVINLHQLKTYLADIYFILPQWATPMPKSRAAFRRSSREQRSCCLQLEEVLKHLREAVRTVVPPRKQKVVTVWPGWIWGYYKQIEKLANLTLPKTLY